MCVCVCAGGGGCMCVCAHASAYECVIKWIQWIGCLHEVVECVWCLWSGVVVVVCGVVCDVVCMCVWWWGMVMRVSKCVLWCNMVLYGLVVWVCNYNENQCYSHLLHSKRTNDKKMHFNN